MDMKTKKGKRTIKTQSNDVEATVKHFGGKMLTSFEFNAL